MGNFAVGRDHSAFNKAGVAKMGVMTRLALALALALAVGGGELLLVLEVNAAFSIAFSCEVVGISQSQMSPSLSIFNADENCV